ncbi:MAG: hypothetical protein K2Y71_20920 [Xanthobacteraceae bacterium]|nr:hypothetical protein [Xanthobacteraceae bacterium]
MKITPPYSLIFISDPEGGTTPECSPPAPYWATPSCIAVGCLMYQDGDTQVTLGQAREMNLPGRPIFDGLLDTPNRKVNVETAEGELVLQADVSKKITRVRIWTNARSEPDRIVIGLE